MGILNSYTLFLLLLFCVVCPFVLVFWGSWLFLEGFQASWGPHCFVFSDVVVWTVSAKMGPEGPNLAQHFLIFNFYCSSLFTFLCWNV